MPKTTLGEHVQNATRTASIATFATTVAATTLSKLETNHAAAALNATSHIVWGEPATKVDGVDLRHTLLGGALNASAMGFWAGANELLPRAKSGWGAALKGALLSGVAYAVDYVVVPKRLTPGFERRLSAKAMFITYGAFAGALAVGEVLAMKRG